MSVYHKIAEKRRAYEELNDSDDDMCNDCNARPMNEINFDDNCDQPISIEHIRDKRLRREIANSNERRRMQSINAGFASLKSLLPRNDGEKMSKASILQQTADYIRKLEHEKSSLIAQNAHLKRLLAGGDGSKISLIPDIKLEVDEICTHNSALEKRLKRDTECSDEGIVLSSGDADDEIRIDTCLDSRPKVNVNVKDQLRMTLENLHTIKSQLYEPIGIGAMRSKYQSYVNHTSLPSQCSDDAHDPIKQEVSSESMIIAEPMPAIPLFKKDFNNHVKTSMSQRNLETIVEAIRHLEGDSVLFDSYRKADAHSEESEKDSMSADDTEDINIDSTSRNESNVITIMTDDNKLCSPPYMAKDASIQSQMLRQAFPQFGSHCPGVIVPNLL